MTLTALSLSSVADELLLQCGKAGLCLDLFLWHIHHRLMDICVKKSPQYLVPIGTLWLQLILPTEESFRPLVRGQMWLVLCVQLFYLSLIVKLWTQFLFCFGSTPPSRESYWALVITKRPPVYTKALPWLSSWVLEVDFALDFFKGSEIYNMTSFSAAGFKPMLLRPAQHMEDHGYFHWVLSSCHKRSKWVMDLFPWECADFSMEHVHNNFDHFNCSTLRFYSDILFLWETAFMWQDPCLTLNVFAHKEGYRVYMFHLWTVLKSASPRLGSMETARFSNSPPEKCV